MNRIFLTVVCCLQVILFTGCRQGKQPLRYGTDACDHCKMLLMDPSFGGEIITQKGKIYKFDDISCMVTFMNGMDTSREPVDAVFVTDHQHPGTLIPAETAFYLRSDKVKSPMASGIAAFASEHDRYEQQQVWQGTELTWSGLKELPE